MFISSNHAEDPGGWGFGRDSKACVECWFHERDNFPDSFLLTPGAHFSSRQTPQCRLYHPSQRTLFQKHRTSAQYRPSPLSNSWRISCFTAKKVSAPCRMCEAHILSSRRILARMLFRRAPNSTSVLFASSCKPVALVVFRYTKDDISSRCRESQTAFSEHRWCYNEEKVLLFKRGQACSS